MTGRTGLVRIRRAWFAALLLGAVASSVQAGDLLLPEWEYEPKLQDSRIKRAATRTAQASYSFVNDTITDTWTLTTSPVRWRAKGWLTLGGIAGVTTGMVFLVDERVRNAVQGSDGCEDFTDIIRYVGNGPGLLALTGGFAATGLIFDRPKERETARLLMEASVIAYGFGAAAKFTLGRSRPGAEQGPKDFHPFSGEFSMPSGETTNAFVMAGIITSQYPSWPVQILAYSLAAAVGAGRILSDGHWTSDVFLGAALGIAVSKSVVYLNRRRKAAREQRRSAHPRLSRHFIQVSTRGFLWTYRF